jgi:hypothetical protein
MKTTLEIPDALFRQAKRRAAEQGITLRELVERALRATLGAGPKRPYRFQWRVERGKLRVPEEVINSRVLMYEYLDRLK